MALALLVVTFVLSIGAAVTGAYLLWHQRVRAALVWGAVVFVAGTVGAHAGATLISQQHATQDAQALHLLRTADQVALHRLVSAYQVVRGAAAAQGRFPSSASLVLLLAKSSRAAVGIPLAARNTSSLRGDELDVRASPGRVLLDTRGRAGVLYELAGPPSGTSTLLRVPG
jgi:hypothetical protein